MLRSNFARTAAKSVLPLLIDLYWFRVLNAISEPEVPSKGKLLAEYGEFLTDLDPRFFHAYYYLSLAIPYPLGHNQYDNGPAAEALVRKGIANLPEDYRLRIVLVFNLLNVKKDKAAALEEFRRFIKVKSAPALAPLSATVLMAEAGQIDEAQSVIDEAMKTLSPEFHKQLEERRRQLSIERELQQLDAAIDACASRGPAPETLEAVISCGTWPSVRTTDQFGGEFSVGPDGRAASTSLLRRLRVPKL